MRSSRVRWDPGPGPGLQPLPRAALIIVDDPLSALNRGIGVIKGFLGDQVKRIRTKLRAVFFIPSGKAHAAA